MTPEAAHERAGDDTMGTKGASESPTIGTELPPSNFGGQIFD